MGKKFAAISYFIARFFLCKLVIYFKATPLCMKTNDLATIYSNFMVI